MLRSVVNYANNSAGNVSSCERRWSIHRLATRGRSSNERTVNGIEKGKSEKERRGKRKRRMKLQDCERKGDVRRALNVTDIK